MSKVVCVLDHLLSCGDRFETWTTKWIDRRDLDDSSTLVSIDPDVTRLNRDMQSSGDAHHGLDDEGAGTALVVKIPAESSDPSHLEALLRSEAEFQRRSAGEGVATVFGFVSVAVSTSGSTKVGLVSRRVTGESVSTKIAQAVKADASLSDDDDGPACLESVRAFDSGLLAEALVALARLCGRLHSVGVVHGDISPGNVLFNGTRPSIVDFGSAVSIHSQHAHFDPAYCETKRNVAYHAFVNTSLALRSGTPGFVAPEVVAGSLPTAASDAYGIGALGLLMIKHFGGSNENIDSILSAWCSELAQWSTGARPDDLCEAASVLEALATSNPAVPTTIEFGPRPPVPTATSEDARSLSKFRTTLTAVVLIALSFGAANVFGRDDPNQLIRRDVPIEFDSRCEASATPKRIPIGFWVKADLWATGCVQEVRWTGQVLTVRSNESSESTPIRNYRLGHVGDEVFVGVWNCADRVSVALYRPTTGTVLYWPELPAEPGIQAAITPDRIATGVLGATPTVRIDRNDCATLSPDK